MAERSDHERPLAASPSAQRMNQFELVAIQEDVMWMLALRDNFPVALDCDATFGQALQAEQVRHGAFGRKIEIAPVQSNAYWVHPSVRFRPERLAI